MEPATTAALIMAGSSVLSSVIAGWGGGNDYPAYKPYGPWMDMQNDIFAGIQEGLREGGYTFSEEMAENIKRSALEQIGNRFERGGERVREGLVPYGNIGAAGRGLASLNVARGQEEAGAAREVDTQRALQKEQSRMGLLQLGGALPDPTKPGYQGQLLQAQQPTNTQIFGSALSQGLATGYNVYQTGIANEQYDSLIDRLASRSSSTGLSSGGNQGNYRYGFNNLPTLERTAYPRY